MQNIALVVLIACAVVLAGAIMLTVTESDGTRVTARPEGTSIEAPGTRVETDRDGTRIQAPGVDITVPKDERKD